ncbi:pentatricopeptide repeat-containing protein [Tanacetum coccineum]
MILAKSGDPRKLKALVNGINSGKFKNVARVSFMDQMKLYAAAGDLESVLCVWHEWRVVKKGPNVESYNIIMGLCAQRGKVTNEALLFKTFSGFENVKLASMTTNDDDDDNDGDG